MRVQQGKKKKILRKPGYELYYRRLSAIVNGRDTDHRVVLDLRSFGGIATIQICVHGFKESIDRNIFDPVCVIEANWQLGSPLKLVPNATKSALDLRILACSASQLMPRLRRCGSSAILEARCSESIGDEQEITFLLEATNLSVPLPERAPLNRAIVGLSVLWLSDSHVRSRIELVRDAGSTTCFTKGNYVLAFPSRPSNTLLKTIILYPQVNQIDLLYGFIRDPSAVLLRAASTLVISGLGFVAAWLMTKAALHSPGYLTPYIGLFITLTLPTLTAFGELAISDRHNLYSRRRDIGFALTATAIGAGSCGMLAAIYLFVSSGFGTRPVSEIAGIFSIVLLAIAGVLLILGATVLAAYRSGFVVPYLCDNEHCDRRIRWRNHRLDCYTTGRVLCSECENDLCFGCVGNYWERGIFTLLEQHDPETYRCLKPEKRTR